MTAGLGVVAHVLADVLLLGFLFTAPRRRMALEKLGVELVALRGEVAGYRAAHENMVESLDRRLLGLERTTAGAAVEVRMASEQLMAHFVFDSFIGEERSGS